MTEWGVVTVLAALAALGAAVIRPVVGLNSSITRLTAKLDALSDGLDALTEQNARSHDRLWAHGREQDERLRGQEARIGKLEYGGTQAGCRERGGRE